VVMMVATTVDCRARGGSRRGLHCAPPLDPPMARFINGHIVVITGYQQPMLTSKSCTRFVSLNTNWKKKTLS